MRITLLSAAPAMIAPLVRRQVSACNAVVIYYDGWARFQAARLPKNQISAIKDANRPKAGNILDA
jgi:hypothetical protein